MVQVELKAEEITRLLTRLARHLSDLSPVMNDIGEQIEAQTRARFFEGVSPDGTPWAAKSQTTIDAYKGRGQSVDYRPLFGPSPSGTGLRDTISRQYGPDFVEVGSNQIYAAVMQFGAAKGAFGNDRAGRPIPWGRIPARPFLGLSDLDQENISADIEEWLERVAAEG